MKEMKFNVLETKENNMTTIEEMCDEFMLYYLPLESNNEKKWIPYAQYERLGLWKKMRNEIIDKVLKSKIALHEVVLLGATWTEKGLIYVAKLNEKGEFELL